MTEIEPCPKELAARILRAFNGGLVHEDDPANPRGYTVRYNPVGAMQAALETTGVCIPEAWNMRSTPTAPSGDEVDRAARAIPGALSRVDVINYLNMPDITAKVCAQAALSALHGSDAVDRVARALYTETREEIGYSTWNGALSFEKAKFHRLAQAAIAAMRPAALSDIAAERQRQINAEGWTPDHDDAHGDKSLALAAACYALLGAGYRHGSPPLDVWPWEGQPKAADPRRNLVKAGALIVAEIERLDRAALRQAGEG